MHKKLTKRQKEEVLSKGVIAKDSEAATGLEEITRDNRKKINRNRNVGTVRNMLRKKSTGLDKPKKWKPLPKEVT